jgi:hypothetical protein
VTALVAALALAVLSGVAALGYAAYTRQSDRVEKVQAENAKLEHDHMMIGEKFAEQTQRLADQSAQLNAAVAAMNRAYKRGYSRGKRATTLPPPFRPLAPSIRQGYAVPLAVPTSLGANPKVERTSHGYAVRWPTIALFASDSQPLASWTMQAWPNTRRDVQIGSRKVLRMVGPYGTVYAWRERNKTYAVVARPQADDLVRPLVRVLA